MLPDINRVKGVHPGAVLEREFVRLGIKKSVFALSIGVYPGIISDITRLRRGFNASLAIKIERALGIEEGYFMILQAYYKIDQEKRKESALLPKPDLNKLRKGLFWDVNLDKLNFQKRKRFVIQRIFERGNDEEISEIIGFYGKNECKIILQSCNSLHYSAVTNASTYLDLKITQYHEPKTEMGNK